MLAGLMPDETEVYGLLALMLLHDARRRARVKDNTLVPLPERDRTQWDTAHIAEGRAMLERALRLFGRGPDVVQAAIASLQCDKTIDWPRIDALYQELARVTRSPVAELNRAVAVAEVRGAAAALQIVDRLGLDDYQYFHCTRAELLRRLGRTDDARDAYRRALELARAEHEQTFLKGRIADL